MSAPNPSTALARVLVDAFARNGVTDAVLAPGSRSTALALAFDAHPGIRLHVHQDERSAAFVALGLARGTGRPAIVLTTSGSATANLHPAVVEADTGGVPLIALTADRPPELHHTGANQTIEQSGLFGGAVRWHADVPVASAEVDGRDGWRSLVVAAMTAATGVGGIPGPVHLNVAFREPTVPRTDDGRTAATPYAFALDGPDDATRVAAARVDAVAGSDVIAALCAAVAAAERGLIVAGAGAGAAAVDLADHLGWPLIAEPHSGSRHGANLILHAGPVLASAHLRATLRPDLVVRFGRTGLARTVDLACEDVPTFTITGRRWSDHAAVSGNVVVADAAPSVAAVRAQVPARPADDWLATWRDLGERADVAINDALAGRAISEPAVARAVIVAVPDACTLFVASSRPIRDVDAWCGEAPGIHIVANRGASGIDGIVSTVQGLALAVGPVVALVGDLSLLHDSNGFLLRPDGVAEVDAVFVVVDNDGGGLFHALPPADEPAFERLFATPHGLDLADLAKLHRLGYASITHTDAVGPAIAGALHAGGRHLLHVRTDRTEAQELQGQLIAAVALATG